MTLVYSGQEAVIPTELVARLEVAAEGSRCLDDSVVIAATNGEMMDWWDEAAQQHVIKAGDGSRVNVTPVTTSIDAALALAERVCPDWTAWEIRSRRAKTRFIAELSRIPDDGGMEHIESGRGAAPALALCIAILKATTASASGYEAATPRSETQTGAHND